MATPLETKLGYFFFEKRLLARALTTKAYALEQQQAGEACEDQQAYSVLGDAVLKTVLTELLIRKGSETCKAITEEKQQLECEANLARISEELGIGYALKLGVGEKQQRIYEQPRVLAESLEAVIGAIYFDGGFSTVRGVISKLFRDVFEEE